MGPWKKDTTAGKVLVMCRCDAQAVGIWIRCVVHEARWLDKICGQRRFDPYVCNFEEKVTVIRYEAFFAKLPFNDGSGGSEEDIIKLRFQFRLESPFASRVRSPLP